jgi:hypothetical protein
VSDHLDDALRPWLARSAHAIASRLRDARAHAEAGRPIDAHDRLEELHRSSVATLRDARGKFYDDAFRHHRSPDSALTPTQEGRITAQSAKISGYNHEHEIRAAIDHTAEQLHLATVARQLDPVRRSTPFELWEQHHSQKLTSHMRGMLSDAQIALHEAIGFLIAEHARRDTSQIADDVVANKTRL